MRSLAADAEPVERDVRPWESIPEAVGDNFQALTDDGKPVVVWRPHETVTKVQLRFWCHGHSTLSFVLHGYSIFSGEGMAVVLKSEWYHVPKKPNIGDIIVFRAAA